MSKISVTAPGKLMLFGEHAVVYGEPCVVTAVDERLEVAVSPGNAGVSIHAPQVKDTRFVEEALRIFFSLHKSAEKSLTLVTKSPFSGKYGFGSSSAVTVATLRALYAYYRVPIDEKKLFEIAYRVIQEVQGVGSGFDIAAAAYGKTLYFKKGGALLEPLISKALLSLPIVVGYSGVKSNTVEIVKRVALKRAENPKRFDRLMTQIGDLVQKSLPPLLAGDWQTIGVLMDENQAYLKQLEVSSDRLDNLVQAARKAGAYGAKLSGAGGGDCMIALIPEKKRTAVETAIERAGGTVLRVDLNAPAVRVEA